jgi:hypothetical protein
MLHAEKRENFQIFQEEKPLPNVYRTTIPSSSEVEEEKKKETAEVGGHPARFLHDLGLF